MMHQLTILSPGLLSTIQDAGRFGYQSFGFSPGGAMDSTSLKLANLLVGNAPGDGAVEMTMLGVTLKSHCTTVISLTGADMEPTVNGTPIPMYEAVELHENDILSCKAAKSGLRTYLAIAGGFDLPLVMGSMSTNLKCQVGGLKGQALLPGDVLPLRQSIPLALLGRRSCPPQNSYPEQIRIRVIPGPQEDAFTEAGIHTFLTEPYTVSHQSDRMGVRLEGSEIQNRSGVDIISDGIAPGAVQIPASGTPIIMMADRQTTGGYAKIATVISTDLKKIAQARPGSKLRFEAVSMEEAVRLKRKEEAFFARLQYQTFFSR